MKRLFVLLLAFMLAGPAAAHPPDEANHRWQTTKASYYADRFYGKGTACGIRYGPTVKGVAKLGGSKKDCGKLVRLRYKGQEVVVSIIDTGPRHRGRLWDLSKATCEELNHCFTNPIDYTY